VELNVPSAPSFHHAKSPTSKGVCTRSVEQAGPGGYFRGRLQLNSLIWDTARRWSSCVRLL